MLLQAMPLAWRVIHQKINLFFFNYFSETQSFDGLDALRVYVATEDGVEHLVATNNRYRKRSE